MVRSVVFVVFSILSGFHFFPAKCLRNGIIHHSGCFSGNDYAMKLNVILYVTHHIKQYSNSAKY